MHAFLIRALMFQAVNGGFSTTKSLARVAAEFDIGPKDARVALAWLYDNGFIDREAADPDPKAPKYITHVWHYKPKKVAALPKRMALLTADVERQDGYGWDLAKTK